jgi:hypothetical protein
VWPILKRHSISVTPGGGGEVSRRTLQGDASTGKATSEPVAGGPTPTGTATPLPRSGGRLGLIAAVLQEVFGMRGDPCVGQEFAKLIGGMGGQSLQDVLELCERIAHTERARVSHSPDCATLTWFAPMLS